MCDSQIVQSSPIHPQRRVVIDAVVGSSVGRRYECVVFISDGGVSFLFDEEDSFLSTSAGSLPRPSLFLFYCISVLDTSILLLRPCLTHNAASVPSYYSSSSATLLLLLGLGRQSQRRHSHHVVAAVVIRGRRRRFQHHHSLDARVLIIAATNEEVVVNEDSSRAVH